MNEDIIRMAREAREQVVKTLPPRTFDLDLFHERFAALVRADEREACAKVCETHTVDDVLVGVGIAQSCAAAIRARGNT